MVYAVQDGKLVNAHDAIIEQCAWLFAGYLENHLVLVKDDIVKYQGAELNFRGIRQALVFGKYLVLLLEN